ncbi:MAG: DUF4384 domain-containing protein [Acidobacteriia bacterium]|nr:DUF4384 domain-containing protein [Terriglobia bacterium]
MPEAPKSTPKRAAPARRPPTAVKAPEPAVPAVKPSGSLPGGAEVVQAVATTTRTTAPAPSAGPALGLKYSILRREGDNMAEVPTDTVFHAGDRIQFSVQTNTPGYLYIISQGSSGTWKPMFPSPDVENGDNRVEGLRGVVMPPGSRIVFDEQTGVEKVFIVLSRQPEPDLEKMIYSLQGKPQPAAAPAPRNAPKQLLVASIDDGVVGRLRNAYARDLVIEKVDSAPTAGEKKEYAVYVVNPSGSSDSRVVADLHLVHQ